MAQNRRYSDWAQHYGAAPDDFLIEDTPAGEIVHSGLAPTHPNISVSEYWGTWQPPAGSLPTPGNDELDRLFHHEAEQMRRMNGAKTWQLWAFAEDLYGDKIRSMRGTNREVDNWDTFSQSSLLQVDESKWPKYVGKHKWLELEINPLDSIPNPHPSLVAAEPKFWCMRNPVIWQHMRVSIELTVRLFRNLIDEESAWLDAILFEDIHPLSQIDPQVPTIPNFTGATSSYFESRAHHLRASRDELANRMEVLFEKCYFAIDDEGTCLGSTWRHIYPTPVGDVNNTIVTVNPGPLICLLNTSTPVADKCIAQVDLGITLFHELCHALWRGRERIDYGHTRFDEPFYESEWANELGYSGENEVFGRRIWSAPSEVQSRVKDHHGDLVGDGPWLGRAMYHNMLHWPDPARLKHNNRGTRHHLVNTLIGTPAAYYHVPAWWSTGMISEDYWSSMFGQIGSNAMYRPYLFSTPYRTGAYKPIFEETEMVTGKDLSPLFEKGKGAKIAQTVMNRFDQRYMEWNRLRPWYDVEWITWSQTPWGWTSHRGVLDIYIRGYAARDQFICQKMAVTMLTITYDWIKTSPPLPAKPTGKPNSEKGGAPDERGIVWIYAALGHLMQEALPYISADDFRETTPKYARWFRWAPGSAEAAAGIPSPGRVHPSTGLGISRTTLPFRSHLDSFNAFMKYDFMKYWMPETWMTATLDAAREISQYRAQNPNSFDWAPFNFKVPDYDADFRWVIRDASSANVSSLDAGHLLWAPAPPPTAGGIAKMALADPESSAGGQMSYQLLRHYTIGQVTDHRAQDDAWIVEPDGQSGYDIYNITDAIRGITQAQYQSIMAISRDKCPMLSLDDQDANALRNELGKSIDRIGKLFIEASLEEITEHNGQSGKSRWISVNNQIFDITGFVPTSPEEKQLLDDMADGQTTPYSIPDETKRRDLIRRLAPLRIGCVRAEKQTRRSHLRPLTERMLRWHDNPTKGVYVAIDNMIFDITGYIQRHPGGQTMFMKCGGTDRTAEFYQYHTASLLQDYQELLVGRLVPEITPDKVQPHQVVLHGWVFSLTEIFKSDNRLYGELIKHGGTDASPLIMQDGHKSVPALTRLYLEGKQAIVAQIADDKVETIPTGELNLHTDANTTDGAWTLVESGVYEITDMLLFPDFYPHTIPPTAAGRQLASVAGPATASWLAAEHAARRIGTLVPGRPRPRPRGRKRPHPDDPPQTDPPPRPTELYPEDRPETFAAATATVDLGGPLRQVRGCLDTEDQTLGMDCDGNVTLAGKPVPPGTY